MAPELSNEFLSHLKSLYPPQSSYVQTPWFEAAAIAFSASNRPEAIPLVLQYALKDLEELSAPEEDFLLLARKMRDSIFKSGLISGYPKAINGLAALHSGTPESLQDTELLRGDKLSTEEVKRNGQDFFNKTYGETAQTVQPFLRSIYPDLEFFVTSFGYGYAYGFLDITSAKETSFAMIAALIVTDTPRQIEWHLGGAVRNGASVAEVRAVRQIAIEVGKAVGIVWKGDIPDVHP